MPPEGIDLGLGSAGASTGFAADSAAGAAGAIGEGAGKALAGPLGLAATGLGVLGSLFQKHPREVLHSDYQQAQIPMAGQSQIPGASPNMLPVQGGNFSSPGGGGQSGSLMNILKQYGGG